MNTRRLSPQLAGLCAGGLLLGTAACSPNPATLNPAPAELATAPPLSRVQHYNLATDAYFEFGQAALRAEGQAKLDRLAAEVPGKQNPRIQISGHTDRLGNERYNVELAQRRVKVVRDYLVDKGVAAEVIDTRVIGAHDPIVTCAGKTGQALIHCLGPNRRTVVEFSAFEVVQDSASAPE